MSKVDEINDDIKILEECIQGIDGKIQELRAKKPCPHSKIAKMIKDKGDAEKLLRKKKDELECEQQKNKPINPDIAQKKAEFDRKDSSYNVSQNNYMRPN